MSTPTTGTGLERFAKYGEARLALRIALVPTDQYAEPPHLLRLLRPRHHRPRGRSPQPRDERPAVH